MILSKVLIGVALGCIHFFINATPRTPERRKKGKKFWAWDLAPKPHADLKTRPIAIKPHAVFLSFDRFNDP